MYKLLPAYKDYVWGGNKLKEMYGLQNGERLAESWALSVHPDGPSMYLASFADYVKDNPKSVDKHGSTFPVLIKYIDAKQNLSVQVHPGDEYALEHEGQFGKTEMWYVVDCDEGAELIYGFNRDVSKEEFERRIKDNTLSEICNYVPVHKGDVFFIAAGTLHAIGAGILIAEVQQSSNTTYRVSDYGRLGADGKPRQLHIEKALDVTKRQKPDRPYGNIGKTEKTEYGSIRELAKCDLFTTSLIDLDGQMSLCREESFVSIVVLEGKANVEYDGKTIEAGKGGSVFIPAGMQVKISGKGEILCSMV